MHTFGWRYSELVGKGKEVVKLAPTWVLHTLVTI